MDFTWLMKIFLLSDHNEDIPLLEQGEEQNMQDFGIFLYVI